MKVLVVCRAKPSIANWDFRNNKSFVYEQAESLKKLGVEYDTCFLRGRGLTGYIKDYFKLRKKIKQYKPDLVHAHYGLSGLVSGLQKIVPVVTTYHGSDINVKYVRWFSYLASKLSKENIFVNSAMPKKIFCSNGANVVPCGVDMSIFYPMDKIECRKKMNLDLNKKYALFAGSFGVAIKNYPLAKKALELSKYEIELIELKGYTREEVNLLLNSVDFLLMTSFSEGSPMVVKEALCCNCPVVSVNVGDVESLISDIKGCYVVDYDPKNIAKAIDLIIETDRKISGRRKMENYSLESIGKKIKKIYQKVAQNGY